MNDHVLKRPNGHCTHITNTICITSQTGSDEASRGERRNVNSVRMEHKNLGKIIVCPIHQKEMVPSFEYVRERHAHSAAAKADGRGYKLQKCWFSYRKQFITKTFMVMQKQNLSRVPVEFIWVFDVELYVRRVRYSVEESRTACKQYSAERAECLECKPERYNWSEIKEAWEAGKQS
jgi:hypothetical protein